MTTDATREPCIDAETLAAWVDAGLSASEAAPVELHLSNCERCQAVLAAFVRSQPAPAVVIAFRSLRSVRMGAAGLAVAASLLLIVWTTRPPALEVPESRVASNEAARAAPPDAPVGPVAPAQPPRPDPSASAAAKPAAAKPMAMTPAALPTGAASFPAAAPPTQLGPPPIAPPVVVASAPPPPQPQQRPHDAAKPASRAGIPAMAEMVSDVSSTVIEIVAPSAPLSPTRWRIVGGTRVDRSSDAGATWTTLLIEPSVTTALTAGVAASQTVCWIVGRDGVVLVTAGGLTLRRVSSPTTDHLVGVTAVDGQRATVTVAGGRTFSTVDGGLTWTPGRLLQGF